MNTGLLLKTNGVIEEIKLDMSLHTNNISLLFIIIGILFLILLLILFYTRVSNIADKNRQ